MRRMHLSILVCCFKRRCDLLSSTSRLADVALSYFSAALSAESGSGLDSGGSKADMSPAARTETIGLASEGVLEGTQ